MATIFDISLINYFSDVFIILFIFTATYAVLMFRKPLGDNKGVNALLAFSVAAIFLFLGEARAVILSTIPWFVIMMVLLIFVLIITGSIGASVPQSLMNTIGTWTLIISIVILLLSVSSQLGQQAGPYLGNQTFDPDAPVAGGDGDVGSGSFTQNLGATLFHPKVLAFMLVIVVATFAVLWIGYTPW